MIELSVRSLIDPLMKATEAGRIQWGVDREAGFVAKLGTNSVNVYEFKSDFTLRVMDATGEVVDWLTPDQGPLREELQRLYNLAGRKARNVDDVLTDILQHLETAPEVTH